VCRLLLTNHHDAEEVAQEVFLKAFQNSNHESDGTYILEAMVSPGQHQCLSRSAAVRLKWWHSGQAQNTRKLIIHRQARVLNRRFLAGKCKAVYGKMPSE
jgi:hypothetical protein